MEQVDPSNDSSFFLRTQEEVGGLVKDDVKLGTLYCTLILATPGAALSDASRVGTYLYNATTNHLESRMTSLLRQSRMR